MRTTETTACTTINVQHVLFLDRNNKMNESEPIRDRNCNTTSDRESQLRLTLERETEFKRRQELLKALWRLHQPNESGAGSHKTDNLDDNAARAKRIGASDVGVACC